MRKYTRLTKEQLSNIISDYTGDQTITINKLVIKYGKCSDAIRKVLISNNIEIRENKNKLTKEKIDRIIKEYTLNNKTQDQISKEIGVAPKTIRKILRRNSIKIRKVESKISKETRNFIYKRYKEDRISSVEIAKEVNLTFSTVCRILKTYKITRADKFEVKRKIKVNDSFFEKINTEEKAYILGFLYADGCNHDKTFSISVKIQENDKHILEDMKRIMNYEGKIGGYNRKNIKHKPISYLSFCSMQISQDLIALGCGPRKSLTCKFPTENQVSQEYLRFFIRGLYDGDGGLSVYFRKGRKKWEANCSICGTEDICQKIGEYVKKQVEITYSITHTKTKEIKVLGFSGTRQINKFLIWLYKDSKIHLNRKFNKYQEFLEKLVNKSSIN